MPRRRDKTKSKIKPKSKVINRRKINNTRKRLSKGGGMAPRNTPWPPPRAARSKRRTNTKN